MWVAESNVGVEIFNRKVGNGTGPHAQYKFRPKQPQTTGARWAALKLQCIAFAAFSSYYY